MVSAGDESMPLQFLTNYARQGQEQQCCLPPGWVNLIPAHGDSGEAAQSEVIDDSQGAVLANLKRWTEDINLP